ncbi:hypothetical protein ADEAN_000054500 [Angomonas deanei]|uniref:Uncharacterized protein n=1 Tax=Angomonas deanei TaxID=59799 RepID=A0A7G2C022_9TRYP|nr:hypothetical protein ADEAN_000054500 [Angomonas deanei]
MYNAIRGMILETPGAPLIGLPKGLPRTLYAWMLTTLHVFATTLPEFYLYDDEAKAEHTSTLLKSVNLLRWSEQVPNAHFFNWSKEVCQTAIPTVSGKRWLSFCQSSFSSLPAVHTREAALLEELIALYPKYAPLRLHYAVSLAFADYPVGSSVALGAVRRDKQSLKTGRYKHADGFHGSVLPLLEYILVPREELDSTILVEVGSFLSQVDCRVPSTWAPVSDTARPPLLTKRHADIISEKAKIDFPDLNFSLQVCL